MATSLTLFIFILFSSCLFGASLSKEHCSSPSCNPSKDTFPVHYPFRLPEFQPDVLCSYGSGFTLSCSPSNQTLIQLPAVGSLSIQTINYVDGLLNITNPKDCVPQLFFDGFNLGASDFTLSLDTESYTYYNCTLSGGSRYYPVSCMSGESYKVLALRSEGYILPNCTVIKNVFAPKQTFGSLDTLKSVMLHWYEPSNCEVCDAMGEACELVGGSYVCSKIGHGLTTGAKFGVILGISIPGFLIFLIAIKRCSIRSETTQEQQPTTEAQLIRNQQPVVLPDLDAPTIESYPKFILGQGDALLESSTGPCAICLSEYKPDDKLRTIPDCNRYFHSDCVDEWLKLKATCPVCRKTPDA